MNVKYQTCGAWIAALLAVAVLGQAGNAGEMEAPAANLPRVIDLGSKQCIPCKRMAPVLEELKKEQAGKFGVEFIDVNEKENLTLAKAYRIKLIPTQVFLDARGKELWRHVGFISKWGILEKWKALGVAVKDTYPHFERLRPAKPDTRPAEKVCFMCAGDVNPKEAVVVKTEKGEVHLCGMHHFFVMLSCLQKGVEQTEASALVNTGAGKQIAAVKATYLAGIGEKGRHWVKAFVDKDAALEARAGTGGSVLSYTVLKKQELACRCGFCDRSLYPEDAAVVRIDGVYSWGCCAHCAMGVAARTGNDIEVMQPDRLTGEMVTVRTLGGYIASIQPPTAVAWYGLRKTKDGKFTSAGCFHQGFFVNVENLKKWVAQTPRAVGRMITIDQSLSDKMKLTPTQIQKACKVGECSPR